VIEPYLGSASSFSEGLACVSVGGKFGYINLLGDFVINPQFEYVGDTSSPDFKDGVAKVKREGEFLYINKKGEAVDAPPSKN
ncbi:MAG: WG repeat-containing protein, partial [Patescibacteria group bacterium]